MLIREVKNEEDKLRQLHKSSILRKRRKLYLKSLNLYIKNVFACFCYSLNFPFAPPPAHIITFKSLPPSLHKKYIILRHSIYYQ